MTALNRYVQLPIGEFELEYLRESAEALRGRSWDRRHWFARPALMDLSSGGSSLYVGQDYDLTSFKVQLDVWNHDHCEVCWQTLSDEGSTNALSEGYFDGSSWICLSCHQFFVEPNDLKAAMVQLMITER